jgi:hypothetical protein
MGFAAFITVKYILAVKPHYEAWLGALSLSNIFMLILGPALAAFFVASSYGLGRLLWTRLGGMAEFPSAGTELLLLSAVGVTIQAIAGWVLSAFGWMPSTLIFFLGLIAFVIEITPFIETLRTALSPPVMEGEELSRKGFTWLIWPILFFVSLTPFIWNNPESPGYLIDPGASFKLTVGHSPIGLDFPLFGIYARIAGPWAANAVNLGLVWLILIGMLEASRRLYNSLPAGLLAIVLFLCLPVHFKMLAQPSPEIVLAFFLMAAYSALTWFLFTGRLDALPLSGVFLGLALSVSSKGIIFALVFLIYAIIGCIGHMRKRPVIASLILAAFIFLTALFGSLLAAQNMSLTGNAFYPLFSYPVEFNVPEPPEPDLRVPDAKPSKALPIPADKLEGVDFPTNYGSFTGVGYKITMSTDGDLSKGPQGLGPLFMAFIPGILLIMITRRHTREAWTIILLLLLVYLFYAYAARIVSLKMLYAIFPFQALITGYIIDRLYLLSKLEEKRVISYIFIFIFIPAALVTFIWTCVGYGFSILS